MRASIRSGALIGAVASVSICLLQPYLGLLVVAGIAAAGALAGLAVAKWLDFAQYGRQLEEGVRAGLLAAGLPGLCALVSLLVSGPHDVHTLALRSHAGRLGLASAAEQLASLGWAELDVLFAVGATVAGILLSAALAQVVGWSKSGHAARAVRQARLTARALQRGESWEPVAAGQASVLSALTGSGIPVPNGAPLPAAAFATGAVPAVAGLPSAFLSAGPAPASQPPLRGNTLLWPAPRPTGAPAPARAPLPLAPIPIAVPPTAEDTHVDPEVANPTEPAVPVAEPAKRAKRKTSRARPVDGQLTDDVRKALAAWAEQNPEAAEAAKAGGRAPVASSYLNSEPPAPKRNRKKNPTRDWIC